MIVTSKTTLAACVRVTSRCRASTPLTQRPWSSNSVEIWGELVIGKSKSEPFLGSAEIRVHGTKDDPAIVMAEG